MYDIVKQFGELLKVKGLTVSTAESMTAGKLGATIVSVVGASTYYKGGVIVYSAELKHKLLAVPIQMIDKYTVVSKEVAEFMAVSVRKKTNTDIGISVTGNAGPTTDTNTKNVGQVFIGISTEGTTKVIEMHLKGSREEVIKQAVKKGLLLVIQHFD